MIIGTTPKHTFKLPFDTSVIRKIRVIYSQNDTAILTKTEKDCVLGNNDLSVTLTQEDTFKFDHKLPVEIQVRVLTNNGSVAASIPKKVGVTKCLETEVIE